jgi:hypothetical protein
MGTTRRSGARWLRTGCAAVAASTALAALASTAVTLGAAGSPAQSSVTAGAVINSVGFFAAVTSRAWIGDPRLDEVRQLTASRRGSELEAEQPGSPPTLVLEWVELPARESEVVAANGLLSLRVMNLSPLTHLAAATVIGDAGSTNSRTQSGTVTFNIPGDSVQVMRSRPRPIRCACGSSFKQPTPG